MIHGPSTMTLNAAHTAAVTAMIAMSSMNTSGVSTVGMMSRYTHRLSWPLSCPSLA
jgi:hypothetical protein